MRDEFGFKMAIEKGEKHMQAGLNRTQMAWKLLENRKRNVPIRRCKIGKVVLKAKEKKNGR